MATNSSESTRLRRKIAVAFTDFARAAADIREHSRFRELLPHYFFTMHCIMRATVPLMNAALRESVQLSHHDPLAFRLVSYYGQHVPEELGHDEWLLANLSSLGIDREPVETSFPPRWVAAMSGSQYYWIHHYHPVTLLGYIAVVEGYPPTEAAVMKMAEKAGVPRETFSSMLRHAKLDQVHRDDLDKFIDTLPLDAEHRCAIGVSALHTIGAATEALREVVAQFEITRRMPKPAGAGV